MSNSRKQVSYGLENPFHTHNHSFICLSLSNIVEADFKKYCLIFDRDIKDITCQHHRNVPIQNFQLHIWLRPDVAILIFKISYKDDILIITV